MDLDRFKVLFGRRLRFLRQLENLTQAELAERAGISLEHVNKLERGAAAASMASIIGLAKALETETANLFLFSDSPVANDPEQRPPRDQGEPVVDWTKFVTRIGSWERNMVTGVMTWSDSLFRLLGFEPGEVAASRDLVFQMAHPEDRERILAALQEVESGRNVERLEYRMRHKAGGWRKLLAHAEVQLDDEGQTVMVHGTIMDVTEQRRLQQALLDSHTTLERRVQERTKHLQDFIIRLGEEIRQRKRAEEALRISDQIVSSSADAMCMVDRSYIYRAVNDAYVLRTGLRREDVLGRHVSAVLGPEIFQKRIKPRLDRAFDDQCGHHTDWYDIPGRGRRFLDTHCFPCRSDAGDIVGVVVNIRDITEREKAEQALRESEKLHRTIFDRADMGILRIAKDGRILEANRHACRILGSDEGDLRGQAMQGFVHPDDLGKTMDSLKGILEGRSDSASVEKRVLRPDGSCRTCYTAVSAVRDPDGELDYLITTLTDISDRMRTEEDLLVYRQMVSSSSDVMIMLDREHRHRAVNKAFHSWFGRTLEEVAGHTPELTLGHDAYHATIKPRLDACLTGKELRLSEWRDFPLMGKRHTDVTFTPCRNSDGEIIGVLITARDDTESHRALLSLLESERNYRFLFDNIRDAIFLHEMLPGDTPGPFLDVNRVACKITGYSREELLGHSPMTLDAPDVAEAYIPDVMSQLARKGHALFEAVLLHKNGSRVPMEIHSVLFTREGRRMILSVGRDVTQRKQAELALRESEAKFREMFEAAGDAIYVHDLEGRIIDANRAARERLGYTREELLSMSLADIDSPKHVTGIAQRLKIAEQGREGIFELMHRRKDGSDVPVEVTTRLIGHQGRPAVIGVARDMTEHRLLEAELRLARLDAEEASRAKSGFLAAMSHEIRTPLNSLLGMLDLARMADDHVERDDCLETARESARSLLRIIHDVLDLSRIEAGATAIEPDAADPREPLEFAARLFARQAAGKGLDLAVEVSRSVPARVVCDNGRLKQILVNLVGNAIRCTETGGVLVRLDADPAGDEAVRLRLEVADTGPGIPDNVRDTLFSPFARGGDIHDGIRQGVGLGLSIVKELAEAMDADLELHSAPGRGTTVAMAFTTVPAEAEEPREAPTPEPARTDRRLRVLVAEDDPVNRMTACRLLEKMGHEAEGVEDGSVVLDMLRRHHFDLVFMDVEMPGMNGLEATRRIRDSRSGRMRCDVPVVAMTAHALKGDRERFLEAGMDDYVAKPVTMDALSAILARVAEPGDIKTD